MINQFILKISRPIALAIWIISLLLFFLRLSFGKPLSESEEAFINLNQSILLISVVIAIISLAFVVLCFVAYLLSTGKLSYEISINETSVSKSEKLAEYKAQLYTLGFQDFAVFNVLSLKNKEALCKVWSYLDETRTVYAEIAEYPKEKYVLAFISDYPDKFRFQTVFNKLVEYSSHLGFSRSFMKSLSAAFDYHLRQQAHFSKTHGQAKLFHEHADIFQSVEDRREIERSVALSYLRWCLKFAIISLIFGFTQYFLAQLIVSLFGGEAVAFINLILVGLFCWFARDLDNRFNWYAKNEEDLQKRKVAE